MLETQNVCNSDLIALIFFIRDGKRDKETEREKDKLLTSSVTVEQ